ncbi:hypothetical protein H4Q32_027470 [Labeo rohita]|uniref:Reverse transcriptase domain-containing protein n=1 Tax=Labeo rohita TaxID=84645 RepID=A0ABQ8L8D5_LABRO|nr:hypothetical protein H4Q32_027470 [Labeo rohita]
MALVAGRTWKPLRADDVGRRCYADPSTNASPFQPSFANQGHDPSTNASPFQPSFANQGHGQSILTMQVHTAKSSYFHIKINNDPDTRNLSKTFNSLLCPPAPPPTTSITADDFATFFTDKTTTISSQFLAPHPSYNMPTRSYPLSPSPSNLSYTLTSTYSHQQQQHISPHRHFPHCIQAGSVTEALRIAKADSRSSVLILLDLSAAFDTVNHQILLSTLSSLGITGIPLRWFESCLTGRSFRVAWGGEVSKAHHLVTGVPQGSVLGPLLFSIYTTSLGPIIQAHGFSYHCYADDTHLYLSFQPDDPTVAARISGCLVDISEWMKEHHLQLNLAKTELLIFPATPTLQHDFTINLDTLTITPSSSARNLGVIFDDQLTFKDHIAKTARSCKFALHNIRKIRPFLTEQATQLLVQALVISRLDYCNALLAGLPSCTIKPLQMIQNAAARLVFNKRKRNSPSILESYKFGWLWAETRAQKWAEIGAYIV